MENNEFRDILRTLNDLELDLSQVIGVYEKIAESTLPLSNTGVKARVFFNWKKNGLVDFGGATANKDSSGWTRLNIYEYTWIKFIQTLREFGFSIKRIKQLKQLLFRDMMEEILNNLEAVIAAIRTGKNTSYGPDQAEAVDGMLQLYKRKIDRIPIEEKMMTTYLGALISRVLTHKEKISLFIISEKEGLEVQPFIYKNDKNLRKQFDDLHRRNFIHVSFNILLEDFIENDKNQKYLEGLGFFNENEIEVLEMIRKKNFKELSIKNNKGELILEVRNSGDFKNDQVREIRRILGLKEYEEVTLKMRNNKHIYFENKVKKKM